MEGWRKMQKVWKSYYVERIERQLAQYDDLGCVKFDFRGTSSLWGEGLELRFEFKISYGDLGVLETLN